MIVVKVGGSLYDLPDLRERLNRFLLPLAVNDTVIVVPGGGAMVDVIREWDRLHDLGDPVSHNLAFGAMTSCALMLKNLIANSRYISHVAEASFRGIFVCSCQWDVPVSSELPPSWDVTSDSISASLAIVTRATRLILLKSIDVPNQGNLQRLADLGVVDRYFPKIIANYTGSLEIVNFRNDR
ncbi:hypothetical protein BH11PLA2_BH11PLA2_42400 [soil metagenome]